MPFSYKKYPKRKKNTVKGKRRKLEEMEWADLRDILDRDFSYFIRMSEADDNGFVKCPTCGKILYWNETDCSHFIKRDIIATRYDERNVIAQCHYENSFRDGNLHLMLPVLLERHGQEAVDELKKLEDMCGKKRVFDNYQLIEKIKYYRLKNKELKKEKCL